jgi:RNA-directed DNA polymerase
MFETRTSTVPITKVMVKEAYRKVKANAGSSGVDKESLGMFQTDLLNNLYVIWNRLSSGSYFPKPWKAANVRHSNGKRPYCPTSY